MLADSERIAGLFSELNEMTAADRAERIAVIRTESPELAAELESLLAAHDEAGGFLERLDAARAAELMHGEEPMSPPERAGPWRLVREIGRGGLGVVYLAEREQGDFEQSAAVKLIKRGMDSELILKRFHHERRILASLEHPNIARLIDGGMLDDGRPYFAMEYIEGTPLTEWCDRNKATIGQRLKLFEQVCRAVQYAHARLIVHRDLKPANILVAETLPPSLAKGAASEASGGCAPAGANDGAGKPRLRSASPRRTTSADPLHAREGGATVKLLDFGIAKLLDEEGEGGTTLTVAGMRAMTPEYAAPEQVRGEPVSAATDVYALGVVLYELLAGHHPYRNGVSTRDGLAKAICDTAPTLPSAAVTGEHAAKVAEARNSRPKALRRRLHGDLDNVILKAMAKDPGRRYGSAEALAEDVRRHLNGLPVKARRETFAYRTSRFMFRHRAGVAATAAVILALVGGLAVALWQAQLARQQARLAELEAQRSERSLDFLTSLFQHGDPRRGTQVESIEELLATGSERARNDLAEDPVLQGSVLLRLAEVYQGRTQYMAARALADEALALLEPLLPENDRRIADAYLVAGYARYHLGQASDAEPLLEEAAARYQHLGSAGKQFEALSAVAGSLRQTQNFDAALALQKQIVAGIDERLGLDSYEGAGSRFALAVFAIDVGDYALAEHELRAAIATFETLDPQAEVDLATSVHTLASLLDRIGRTEEAGAMFERAIALSTKLYGENSAQLASTQFGHGIFLLGQYQPEAAETTFRAILANSEATPTTRAHAHRYLGRALRDQWRLEEAIIEFKAAEQAYLDLGGTGTTEQAHRSAADRGRALALDGDPENAVEVLTAAVAGIEAARGDSHYNLIRPLTFLGMALHDAGNVEIALAMAERALAMAEAILEPEHAFTAEARELRDRLQAIPGDSKP